jgi:hypothetical protein
MNTFSRAVLFQFHHCVSGIYDIITYVHVRSVAVIKRSDALSMKNFQQ